MEDNNLKQIDILKLCEPLCKKYDVKFNKSDLSQYLSGKTVPNQDKLYILCQALGVSEAWLIGYDVNKHRDNELLTLDDFIDNLYALNNSELQTLDTAIKDQIFSNSKTFDLTNHFSHFKFEDSEDENINIINTSIIDDISTLNFNGVSKVFSYINDLKATNLYSKTIPNTNSDNPDVTVLPSTISLPAFDIKVSAGLGSYLNIEEKPNLETYPLNNITRKADHTLKINGNSMEPLINDGDTVFILEQPMINEGEIGIFIYDDEIFCKQLVLEDDQIILRSINKSYKDIIVSKENFFQTIGKVLL